MSTEPELSPMVVEDDEEAMVLAAFRENPRRTMRLMIAVRKMPEGLSEEEQRAYIVRVAGDA